MRPFVVCLETCFVRVNALSEREAKLQAARKFIGMILTGKVEFSVEQEESDTPLDEEAYQGSFACLLPRDLATVLASLRFWQDEMAGDENCYPEHFEGVTRMTAEEIDRLCERLNCEPRSIP